MGALSRDLGTSARLDDAIGDGCPELRHHVHTGVLDIPVERDTGRLNAEPRGFSELGADAIAGDQGHIIGHRTGSPGGRSAQVGAAKSASAREPKVAERAPGGYCGTSVVATPKLQHPATRRQAALDPQRGDGSGASPMICPPLRPWKLIADWMARHRDPTSFGVTAHVRHSRHNPRSILLIPVYLTLGSLPIFCCSLAHFRRWLPSSSSSDTSSTGPNRARSPTCDACWAGPTPRSRPFPLRRGVRARVSPGSECADTSAVSRPQGMRLRASS